MSNWIITPDKYLIEEETKQLRKTYRNTALPAKAKGIQSPVRDALIIEVAINTGLRVSELANLKIEHLHLKKGQNSLLVKYGKGNKNRIVHFGINLKNQILEYLNYQNSNSEYVFPSQRGEKMTPSGIQQVFKKYAKKARLSSRYSIHSLRHTYAVRLYKASSYNLRMVQKMLGHSSPTVTQVYADVLGSDIEKAIADLEDQ